MQVGVNKKQCGCSAGATRVQCGFKAKPVHGAVLRSQAGRVTCAYGDLVGSVEEAEAVGVPQFLVVVLPRTLGELVRLHVVLADNVGRHNTAMPVGAGAAVTCCGQGNTHTVTICVLIRTPAPHKKPHVLFFIRLFTTQLWVEVCRF